MNLSKVHSAGNAFEPETLIARKLDEEAVFGSIIVERLPAEPKEEHPKPPPEESSPSQEDAQQEAPEEHTPPADTHDQSVESAESAQFNPAEDETQVVEEPESGAPSEQPIMDQIQPEPESAPTPEPEPGTGVEESIVQPAEEQPSPPQPEIPIDNTEQLLTEAYEKGVREGLQQAEQDFGSATQSLLQACKQIDSLRETILRNSVGDMQALVLAIAEKILRISVQEQSDTVLLTVEEAIQKAVKSDELKVYINPEDYEAVEQKAPDLMQGLSGLNNLLIKKDMKVERGGCRVESENCTVDATLLSQLEIVSEQLSTP